MSEDVVTASTALSIEELGRLIAAKRGGRGVRAAAMDVGVSPATLSRVENGHMPDLETFAKICRWLGRDPREFLRLDAEQNSSDDVVAGPCVVCGGVDYPLSMGGPSICPHCDCGYAKEISPYMSDGLVAQLQRARDEIVALRKSVERHTAVLRQGHAEVRDAALEEAALVCERRRDETGPQEAYAVLDVESYTSACGGCAYDIRALALKGTARDE